MTAVEFHDSYLLAVDEAQGTLDLDAMVYRGGAGSKKFDYGSQRVRLRLRELKMDGDLGEMSFDIYRDRLLIEGVNFCDHLLLPSTVAGRIELMFGCREDGREVTFRGIDLGVEVAGESPFGETTQF